MKTFKAQASFLFPVLTLVFLILSGCTPANSSAPPVETDEVAAPIATDLPTVVTDLPADVMPGWKLYEHEQAGFSFQYPEAWFGPEVYEVEDDLRIEIGSDVVYPYGTDRTEQNYTVQDSYYILIQYRPNTENQTMEDYKDSSWISPPLGMFDLADGESRSTPRSLEIKVRDLEVGQFKGVEYIATLSDTAQTERFYSRQIFLLDEDLNILMISASPNNVEITDAENWKDDYQRVEEANLDILYQVMDSIVVE